MRQEVDIRYVVTSLEGSAQHLYEDVYCQRGQMENLIKLHKAQLASDRMSCHNATANQVRLALHTATFWLMHCVRSAIPQTNPLARCEFATLRERLIKIGARVIEHIARIRVQSPTKLPGGSTVPRRRAWPDAVRPLSHGAACPDEPPTRQINPQCVPQRVDANRSRRTDRRRACASPAGKNARRGACSGLDRAPSFCILR
jgi:hypothetical protein